MARRLCSACGRWKVLRKSGEVQAPCAVFGSMVVYDPQLFRFKYSSTQKIFRYTACSAVQVTVLHSVLDYLCELFFVGKVAAAKNAVFNGSVAIGDDTGVVPSGSCNGAAGAV